MKKKRFAEEQITYALAQESTGETIAESCRRLGVSQQTFYRWKKYRWKKKFGAMGLTEIRRLKQLQHRLPCREESVVPFTLAESAALAADQSAESASLLLLPFHFFISFTAPSMFSSAVVVNCGFSEQIQTMRNFYQCWVYLNWHNSHRIRNAYAHCNHLLVALHARQVALGSLVIKKDGVACVQRARSAIARGHGDGIGHHEEPLPIGRSMPRPGPVGSEAHHGKSHGGYEICCFKRRGGRREVTCSKRQRAVLEMRKAGGVDKETDVFQRDDHCEMRQLS